MLYLYLHGFASGPGTRKGQFFKQKLVLENKQLLIPDLSQGDFPNTTITKQVALVRHLIQTTGEPVVLLGSSLGGFIAALVAEMVPQVKGIFLIAPGFQFYERRKQMMGENALQKWETEGQIEVYHHHLQKMMPLYSQFIDDARQYEGQQFTRQIPAMVIHGLHDEVVPYEVSLHYVQQNPKAHLVLLHADHGMVDVLPELWDYFTLFRHFLKSGDT